MDPLEFLRRHPPFDRLDDAEMARVGESLEIAYAPRGTRLLTRGGEPARSLSVIRKGAVQLEREGEVLRVLEEGDCFGFPSLLGRASPHADVVVAEDALLYRIPEATYARLLESSPAFSQFFLLDLAGRLRQAAAREPLPVGRELATPVGRLPLAPLVTIAPGATVQEAATRMRDARVSSLLVLGKEAGEPPGILTDRDLRSRVLAPGLGPETPVSQAASRPLATLASGASLFEALLFFLEQGVHHAPIEEGGRLVGMLTDTDLLRLEGRSPLAVLRGIDRLAGPEGLASYAREVAGTVSAQVASGVEAAEVGRIVARLSDALVRRLLRLAEEALGPPPCAYAWIVLGSEGRMEQALLTDQDNALVYAEETPQAAAWFGALAERVVGGLVAAGFPPCPGGYMATNWHRPLAAWVELFRGYADQPTPEALVAAGTFFDFRAVAGGLSLEPLEEEVRRAGREGIFVAQLARAALEFTPPLGLLRQVREEEGGVDLKKGGIAPIVALARLYALTAGSAARPTLERLAAAARAGTLSEEGASTLAEAFRFLQRLRLAAQIRALRAGEPPGNRVPLDGLSPLERVHLKEVFLALREIQEGTALRFSTQRLR